MSLLEQAVADVAAIAGSVGDFGSTVTLTNPSGSAAQIVGLWNDIHRGIDPETGLPVSARTVTFVASFAAIDAAGLGSPTSAADADGAPWRVTKGAETFIVEKPEPDASIELLTLYLGSYSP